MTFTRLTLPQFSLIAVLSLTLIAVGRGQRPEPTGGQFLAFDRKGEMYYLVSGGGPFLAVAHRKQDGVPPRNFNSRGD